MCFRNNVGNNPNEPRPLSLIKNSISLNNDLIVRQVYDTSKRSLASI